MKKFIIILNLFMILTLVGCEENLMPSQSPEFNDSLGAEVEEQVTSSGRLSFNMDNSFGKLGNYAEKEKEPCFSVNPPEGWFFEEDGFYPRLSYAPDNNLSIVDDPYWKLNIYGMVNEEYYDNTFTKEAVREKMETKSGTEPEAVYFQDYLLRMTKYPSFKGSSKYNYYYAGITETKYLDTGEPYAYVINMELVNCPEDFYEEAWEVLESNLELDFDYQIK